jgi:AcrR family transcriptional regulator
MTVANTRTPRGAWVEAGLQALSAGGPDGVRIEALAESIGVSKGGFYWHFANRHALLTEMLDAWEKSGTEEIIARVESQPADPRARLRLLFEERPSLAVDLAIRDWSRRNSDVAERVRRVDNRRMEYLRSLFGQLCGDENDVEARSLLAYSLALASYSIAAQHGNKTRSQVLQLAVDRLLSGS